MKRLISIQATKFVLTDAVREYVLKKVFSIEKFIHGYSENAGIFVEVGMVTSRHHKGEVFRAEIQIMPARSKKGLRATAEETDIYKAIDKAKDEIKKELVRTHGKNIARARDGARKIKSQKKASK